MYKIVFGNEFTESRLLTAAELDRALELLADVFEDRVYITGITSYPESKGGQ